jgi:hypothetical protein
MSAQPFHSLLGVAIRQLPVFTLQHWSLLHRFHRSLRQMDVNIAPIGSRPLVIDRS